MLSINTNLSSLIAQSSLKNSTSILNQAVERMTTGYKINHAKDNAANYSISTNMTTKINSYMVAEDNAASALDMISTAEGTLNQIQDKLERLRALQEQASNGTYGEQSLKAINAEVNALVDEIERLYSTAEYNGIKVFAEAEPISNEFRSEGFIEEITRRDTSVMTPVADINPSASISSGEYSISTTDEFVKFAEMYHNGNITGGEFVLAKDLDFSELGTWTPFDFGYGDIVFDGNGYVISNISGSALFNMFTGTIKNLGLENVNIMNGSSGGTGSLVNNPKGSSVIENCYAKGSVNDTNSAVGGLIGGTSNGGAMVKSSYFEGTVTGTNYVGGLIGKSGGSIIDSYANATITGNDYVGGLAGCIAGSIEGAYVKGEIISHGNYGGGLVGAYYSDGGADPRIINSYVLAKSTTIENIFVSMTEIEAIWSGYKLTIEDSWYNSYYDALPISTTDSVNTTLTNVQTCAEDYVPFTCIQPLQPVFNPKENVIFQVGILSNESSQIALNTGFVLDGLIDIRNIGLNTTSNYLTQLDIILATVSAKQTEYGAASNRLESVLEEIQIQYDNLVSSRSTIRDADIAEESSRYIQQQILQQASATLLSTANQSPAIALQLI